MRSRLRRGLAVAAAAGGLLLVAAPAAHAADGRISELDATSKGLRIVFGATELPEGQSLDPASVTVTLAGTELESAAKAFGTTAAPARRSILVMDVSGSMAGERIAAARQAAASYVRSLPADVAVGIVTFADNATVRLPPTADRAKALASIASLAVVPDGGTALYAGTVAGTKAAGANGVRNLLLLSDGEDDGSNPVRLPTAVAAVRDSGVTLDAVSLGAGVKVPSLKALAAAGGGKAVSATDVAALDDAFTAAANAVSNQLVIDAVIPADAARGSQQVVVTATAGATTVSDQAVALLPAAPSAGPAIDDPAFGPKPVPVATSSVPGWVLPVSIGALFLGLAVVFAIAFAGNRGDDADRGRVRRRLSRYSLSPRSAAPSSQDSAAPGALGGSAVARSAVELAGRVTQSRDVDTMLGKQLDGAGVPMKPAEWALIHVGLTLGLGLLGLILSGFEILPAALGLIVGFVAPYLYLSYRRDKRCKEFDAALPDTLQLLAGSLAAGYSLPQAVDTVSREAQGVMATELNRAIVEARLGVPLEEALDDIAGRMASKDFSWVVMAIRINRDVGGNLAEVLTSVAATMRERERLRRQVKALSAEGRLSAWILGALPVLFAVYLVLVRPEYVGKLFTTPVGLAMVVVGIGLLLVGAVWLRKVVTVEV